MRYINPRNSVIATLRWTIRDRTGKPHDRELNVLTDAAFRAAGYKDGYYLDSATLDRIEKRQRGRSRKGLPTSSVLNWRTLSISLPFNENPPKFRKTRVIGFRLSELIFPKVDTLNPRKAVAAQPSQGAIQESTGRHIQRVRRGRAMNKHGGLEERKAEQVGYGKPPKLTRFKPGAVGQPERSPKGCFEHGNRAGTDIAGEGDLAVMRAAERGRSRSLKPR